MEKKLSLLAARILSGLLMLIGLAFAGLAPVQAADSTRVIIKFDKSSQPDARSKAGGIPGELRAQRMGEDLIQRMGMRSAVTIAHQRRLGIGADLFVLSAASPVNVKSLLERMRAQPGVAYAVEDRKLQINFTPDDPLYNEQWHYFEADGGIRAPAAWELSTGQGVVVADVDTGYTDHADLTPNILPGYDFISDKSISRDGDRRDADAHDKGDWFIDFLSGALIPSSWHGTHTAGTIAAAGNNGVGVVGVAFNARIVPVRVLGVGGGYISDIYDGVVWAAGGTIPHVPANANPAKVINMSLGGGGPCDEVQQGAIDTARSLGTTVVVSAGNGNTDASLQSPASCKGVITVAATDRSGHRAPYSNIGEIVDVAAPGGDTDNTLSNGVLSTVNAGTKGVRGDGYNFYNGTSMAAPHVTGVAALMASVKPSITPNEIECTIKATARPFPDPASCPNCGAGILNALGAVRAAKDNFVVRNCARAPVQTKIHFGRQTGISGERADQVRYFIARVQPNKVVTVKTSGGIGDQDLFISLGSAPTLGAADCVSANIGNGETCVLPTPSTGTQTLRIMLYGYTEFRDVDLVVSQEDIQPLVPGTPVTGLSGATNSVHIYRYVAPAAGGTLDVKTVNGADGTGDVDLRVIIHDPATGQLFLSCNSDNIGNAEHCSVPLEPNATYDVVLLGYQAYSDVTMRPKYTGPVFLTPGEPEPIEGAEGSVVGYTVEVPEGTTNLTVTAVAGTGDADLHVTYLDPAGSEIVCSSVGSGTATETCSLDAPGAGFYLVQVSGFTDYAGWTLTATLAP